VQFFQHRQTPLGTRLSPKRNLVARPPTTDAVTGFLIKLTHTDARALDVLRLVHSRSPFEGPDLIRIAWDCKDRLFRIALRRGPRYSLAMTTLPNDGPDLLGSDDPPPFEVINREGGAHMLLVCDHASNVVPNQLEQLGLPDEAFEKHISYDIGADAVTRGLAARLDAQAVLAGYSRLVIDVNRPPGHPDSIMAENDGIAIPANQDLSPDDRRQRVRQIFEPYHDAVNRALARLWDRGPAPAILSIHSFSPTFGGKPRPWDIGVLWNRDPRIAVPLMEHLERFELEVGDNEPYSGHDLAYTIDMHGSAAGIANCAIEINQNQIRDKGGVLRWVDILSECVLPIFDIPGLHRVERF
jgi:predicted N-formylglutamate amidohydrolase